MMNQDVSNRNSSFRRLQIAMVVGILIGFPVISIIVNMKGAAEGKAFYSEIKNNLGMLPDFKLVGWNNDTISLSGLKGKVVVASLIGNDSRDEVLDVMKAIVKTEQFREEVDNLQFITFDYSNDSSFIIRYLQNMNVRDREMWHILSTKPSMTINADNSQSTEQSGVVGLSEQMKLPNNFTVSLVDTEGVIRRLYDVRKPEDRKLLVEHISIMPIKRKKNVEKKDQKSL